jgi:hypothetical protein
VIAYNEMGVTQGTEDEKRTQREKPTKDEKQRVVE